MDPGADFLSRHLQRDIIDEYVSLKDAGLDTLVSVTGRCWCDKGLLTSAPLAVGDAASLRDCQLPPAQLQCVSLSWALSASPAHHQ